VSEFATEKKHELIGKAIMTTRKDGRLCGQGEITNVIYDGSNVGHILIIQWFDWFMGERSNSSAIKLIDLCGTDEFNYLIFDDNEDRNDYYNVKAKYFNRLDDAFIKKNQQEEAA
jgi:hypothetical protein